MKNSLNDSMLSRLSRMFLQAIVKGKKQQLRDEHNLEIDTEGEYLSLRQEDAILDIAKEIETAAQDDN